MVTDAEVTVLDKTEGAANSADVDTETLTINNKIVHRQRVRLSGELAGDLAQVNRAPPEMNDYGLIVKDPNTNLIRKYQEMQSLYQLQNYEKDNLPQVKASLITRGTGLK